MKKILYVVILISYLFFSIISYLSYSYYRGYEIVEDYKVINIEKNASVSNEEYVDNLIYKSKEANIDLAYLNQNIENRKTNLTYYITTNLDENKTFTKYLEGGASLNYPNFISTTNFNEFDEIKKYTLNFSQFFVYGTDENIRTFTDGLLDEGYNYKEVNNPTYQIIPFYSTPLILIILLFIIIILFSMILYQSSLSKKIAIYKINGYTLLDSLVGDLMKINIYSLITFLIIMLIFIIITIVKKWGALIVFKNLFILSVKYLLALNLFFILIFILIYSAVGIKQLKNNFIGKRVFVLTYVVKISTLILIFFISVKIPHIYSNYLELKREYIDTKDLYEYSYLSTFTPNLVGDNELEEENFKNLDEQFQEFYFLTKEPLKGILGNFIVEDKSTKGYVTGTVNDNYLKYNKIYDEKNNLINPDGLPTNKITYLIPEKYRGNKEIISAIEQNESNYCSNGSKCFNYVYVKNDSKYYVIDDLERRKTEYIVDPIVSVLNQESVEEMDNFGYYGRDMTSYISSGSYIVSSDFEKPYETIKPYIEESGLEEIIRETPLIADDKLERSISLKNKLIIQLITFFLLLVYLFISIYFLINTYLKINCKKFSINVINGENINMILSKYYIIQTLVYMFSFSIITFLGLLDGVIILNGRFRLSGYNTINPFTISLILIIIVIEIIITKYIFSKIILSELNKNLKGDL